MNTKFFNRWMVVSVLTLAFGVMAWAGEHPNKCGKSYTGNAKSVIEESVTQPEPTSTATPATPQAGAAEKKSGKK